MHTTATHWERAPQAAPAARDYTRASDKPWAHFASLARIYIICTAGITLLEALLTPESLNWMALQLAGPGWRVAVAVALVVHALLLLDAVVNDWLPASVTLRTTWRHRAWLLGAVAITQGAVFYLFAVYLENAHMVMARVGFDALTAAFMTLFDVTYRRRFTRGAP